MEDEEHIDSIINEVKRGRRTSGFSRNLHSSSNNKNNNDNNVSEKLIESNENNNKNEFTFCSINLNGWFTIINLVSGALGGGVLTFPNILKNIGIFNGIICYIFVSFSIYFSLDLLRRFVVDTKLYSYASITQATLGYIWLIAYAVSSFIVYMLSVSSYLKSLYNYTISIIPGIDKNNVANFFYYFITYIIEVILCIFTSNLSKIYILSTICFCIFFIILIKIIIESIYNMSTKEDVFNYVTAFTIQDGTNSWEKFLSIMSKINEFLFGFISHSTFPTLLNYFHSPNDDEKTRKINKIQLIILYTIYGLFTIFGLFCLSSEDKVIKKTLDNPGEYIINILFIIYLITLVPIRYIIIRDNYTSILKQDYLPAKYEIPTTCLCLLICNLIACFAKDNIVQTIFIQILSGIFGVFICFILPVINFVKLNDKSKIRSIIGYIISIIFLLIGIFSIIFSIKKEVE